MGKTSLKYKHPEYLFIEHTTSSYSNLSGRFSVTTAYTAPEGYSLLSPIVVKTPNDNWMWAHATKTNDTTISISGGHEFTSGISGVFTLLLVYKYVGGGITT